MLSALWQQQVVNQILSFLHFCLDNLCKNCKILVITSKDHDYTQLLLVSTAGLVTTA